MSVALSYLPYYTPLVYLLSACGLPRAHNAAWSCARITAILGLALTAVQIGLAIAGHGQTADATGLLMALLVTFLGWVIIRYSHRYLEGEAGQRRYLRSLLFTLAAVNTVVVTRHLGLLIAAWAASSLCLHYLLTFYSQRRAALIVAHKKFLASRLAELCLAGALVLIYRQTGTLDMPAIAGQIASMPSLPLSLQAAAVLLVLGAILKSAQLPVHGWLIQVMEAPTPVSALLHAGIVNLGGYVLIRVADLLSAAPVAQALAVIVGGLTAVLAGLVMMTRISIKVRLAWSTCAQMGFMLMECGLGLYALAFLHLIAHSLYKAHAFLTSGETVAQIRRQDLARVTGHAGMRLIGRRLVAVPVMFLLMAVSEALWHRLLPALNMPSIALFIVALALAPLMSAVPGQGRHLLRGLLSAAALTQLYFLWHIGFSLLVPATAVAAPWLTVLVAVLFVALYGIQSWVLAFPQNAFSIQFYRWAYAGFYLDERFTRLTFRIWPVAMPARQPGSLTPYRPALFGEQA